VLTCITASTTAIAFIGQEAFQDTKPHSFIVGWKYRKQEEGTLVANQDDFSMTNEGIERKMLGSRSQCAELPGWFAGKIFGSR
jgi:hypothetical protein